MLVALYKFASHYTFKRVVNVFKLFISYYGSRILGKELHWGMPMSLSVEPTTSCNLRCPQCPSGLRTFSRPTGMMSLALFEKIINEQADTLLYITLYFQGEPYLNKDFLKMVAVAHRAKVFTATSTNGHYLTDGVAQATVASGLKRMVVSVDGATQQTYEKYRIGGNLEKVKAGIANVNKWKQILKSHTPEIELQFIAFSHNEHELAAMQAMAEQLAVNKFLVKTAQIYDYENSHEFIPKTEELSRYIKRADGTWQIKSSLANHCWRMWSSSVITWDGKVVPCCFDKDAQHTLGTIGNQSFKMIWRSQSYQQFRSSVMKGRKEIAICSNCTEGLTIFANQ